MHRSLLILLLLCNGPFLDAKNEDFVWVIGSSSRNIIDSKGFQWGSMTVDFSNIQPEFNYSPEITLDMQGVNASICSPDGALHMYGNGMTVHSKHHKGITGADTLAYSNYWELFSLEDYFGLNGEDWVLGFPTIQGLLMLPNPEKINRFTILYNLITIVNNSLEVEKLLTTEIVYDPITNEYIGLENDKVIYEGENLNIGQLQACRHANGRDWWIIQFSKLNEKLYYFLWTQMESS